MAKVLSLKTIIIIRKILLLLIPLIDLIFLILWLAYSQNHSTAIILLTSNWLTYLVGLQTHLMLIRSLVPTLIQKELKSTFLTLPVVLSLTSSTIFCSNVVFISTQTLCNLIWTLQRSTLQWPISLESSRTGLKWVLTRRTRISFKTGFLIGTSLLMSYVDILIS